MDRLQSIGIAIALAACSGPAGPRPLARGETAGSPAQSFRHRLNGARGVLAYAAAIRDNVVISVELGERFELVSRDLTAGAERELARVDLGPPDYDIDGLAVDAGGALAYVASIDGTVRAVDLAAGAVTSSWHVGAPATAVALSNDGAYVATGSKTGVVCLRRRVDGALLHCVVAHTARVSALDFGDGVLASCSWDGSAAIWDIPTMTATARLEAAGSANDIELDPDSTRAAIARSAAPPERTPEIAEAERTSGFGAADPGAIVAIWDLRSKAVANATGHAAAVTTIAWTQDGRRVLSGSWDRTVRLWNTATMRELHHSGSFGHLVRDIAVDERGGRFVVAAWIDRLDARSVSVFDLLYPGN